MAAEPHIQPLSHSNRTVLFIVMCVVFLVLMPVFVFYATGYRLSFSDDTRSIVSVGGLYINTTDQNVEMFVDNEPVEQMRIFRNAAYIQNLSAGLHEVHVQGDGVVTWVKELPVYDFLVTEAAAFTMPKVPQIRLVPEYTTAGGSGVVVTTTGATSTVALFPNASTTSAVLATTTAKARLMTADPEYEYVESLFASSTKRAVEAAGDEPQNLSLPGVPEGVVDTLVATSTQTKHDIRLYKKDGDVYAQWTGSQDATPYYFCVNYKNEKQIRNDYGDHVYKALVDQRSNELLTADSTIGNDTICRKEIRIDRKQQKVQWFSFFPGDEDLVLMLLEDGLYVIEIDDRGWQNTQLLYPGTDLEFVVDGSQIFVYDGQYYLELLTEIPR